jgi:hypothetical protein
MTSTIVMHLSIVEYYLFIYKPRRNNGNKNMFFEYYTKLVCPFSEKRIYTFHLVSLFKCNGTGEPLAIWWSKNTNFNLALNITSEHNFEYKTMKLLRSVHATWVIEGNNILVTFLRYHICNQKLVLASCLKSEKDLLSARPCLYKLNIVHPEIKTRLFLGSWRNS